MYKKKILVTVNPVLESIIDRKERADASKIASASLRKNLINCLEEFIELGYSELAWEQQQVNAASKLLRLLKNKT